MIQNLWKLRRMIITLSLAMMGNGCRMTSSHHSSLRRHGIAIRVSQVRSICEAATLSLPRSAEPRWISEDLSVIVYSMQDNESNDINSRVQLRTTSVMGAEDSHRIVVDGIQSMRGETFFWPVTYDDVGHTFALRREPDGADLVVHLDGRNISTLEVPQPDSLGDASSITEMGSNGKTFVRVGEHTVTIADTDEQMAWNVTLPDRPDGSVLDVISILTRGLVELQWIASANEIAGSIVVNGPRGIVREYESEPQSRTLESAMQVDSCVGLNPLGCVPAAYLGPLDGVIWKCDGAEMARTDADCRVLWRVDIPAAVDDTVYSAYAFIVDDEEPSVFGLWRLKEHDGSEHYYVTQVFVGTGEWRIGPEVEMRHLPPRVTIRGGSFRSVDGSHFWIDGRLGSVNQLPTEIGLVSASGDTFLTGSGERWYLFGGSMYDFSVDRGTGEVLLRGAGLCKAVPMEDHASDTLEGFRRRWSVQCAC